VYNKVRLREHSSISKLSRLSKLSKLSRLSRLIFLSSPRNSISLSILRSAREENLFWWLLN